MTNKEQKSAEVAQETAAVGQKSTEVLELQRRIAEHLQRIKSTATLAQYAPASQAMRETLHSLAHHATEALKALEVINSGAKMALERFIHIKDGNLIISRSQWIYPHATTEFAGPRDEDRYAAIGHRDGDICLSFHGAHIDAADAAIMLSAAPQKEAQEPYSIDADPQGIRAVVAEAITGALAFGAHGTNPPPDGHWLTPFWTAAKEDAAKPAPAITWPKARDVGRIGDMSPSAHLRVGLDSDNDVYVSVWDEHGGGSVEFCNGGGGGGQSRRTRLALIALMVAMEADNAEKPSRDWWAQRTAQGGTT